METLNRSEHIINDHCTTHFALPERYDNEFIEKQIKELSNNSVVDGVMRAFSGILAVLNDKRQILAVNDTFIKMLNLEDESAFKGLRPGEVLHCIHACEEAGGCGTSKYCSTCGAAIAIVSSLDKKLPSERRCFIKAKQNSHTVDLALKVRACPIEFKGEHYVLLMVQDISNVQRWASLERMFFHDLKNMMCGINGKVELLRINNNEKKPDAEYIQEISRLSRRIVKEIDIHKKLFEDENIDYQPVWDEIALSQVITDIKELISAHSAVKDKEVVFSELKTDINFVTDCSLLERILLNMIINALEASSKGDVIKLWIEEELDAIEFHVWNHTYIPENVALRIFEKNFTTKSQAGRGFGTYCVKYFGEQVLSGKVSFTTSPEDGTEFIYKLYL